MEALPVDLARFDWEWRRGDRDLARELAREYIDRSHPDLRTILSRYSMEGVVALIEGYRDAGREGDRIIAEMWLLTQYRPQVITGELDIRLPGPRAIANGGHE